MHRIVGTFPRDKRCLNVEIRLMVHFSCPHCRVVLKAANEKIGKLARCPKCGSAIEVPKSLGGPPPHDQEFHFVDDLSLHLPVDSPEPMNLASSLDTDSLELELEWERTRRRKQRALL